MGDHPLGVAYTEAKAFPEMLSTISDPDVTVVQVGQNRSIMVAACAPASHGFVPPEHVAVTERVIGGRETSRARIREHVERMLAHHVRILERAGGTKPHVAMIPEDCLRLVMLICRHRRAAFCAAAIDEAYARYVERIGEVCRRFGMYVVGATMTHRHGRFYNTAVMQDPSGRVIASYDKSHLPRNGEYQNLEQGKDLPVFDTPLGKVGFLICWDIVFPEPVAVLALKGAEIIFQPTFGHWEEWSDVTARSRCHDWSVPLAVSMWGGCAGIIDQEGRFVARTGQVPDSLAVGAVQLGAKRKFVYLENARIDKLRERRPELYGVICRRPRVRRGIPKC